jgi:acyl dehydratase
MTAATVFETPDQLAPAVGCELGTTSWVDVGGGQIDDYVRSTGDVAADGAVPPLLLLALTNLFMPQLVEVRGVSLGVNYGTGEVRFPASVPVGARLRASARLTGCEEVRGGVQSTIRITLEAEGVDGPVCTVDALSRWIR